MLNPYQTRGNMKAKIAKMSFAIAAAALSFTGLLSADTTSIQVGTGYRQDSLTSIVSQRGALNPRAKSNLHYRDVEIALIAVKAKTSFGCCESYIRADFDYGWVLDGKLREKLSLKNRYSNVQFAHNGYVEEGDFLDVYLRNDLNNNSHVWDLDIGFVYPIECGCDDWKMGPALGFTVNRQQLHGKRKSSIEDASFSDSIRDIFDINEDSGSSGHSGNHNRTTWWGPWFGFDFAYDSHDCWNLYGEFEIHIGRVRHRRGGNGDNDFIDHFNNTRSYWGPSIKIGSKYIFCQDWYLDGSFYYSKFYSFNSSRDDIKWASANIRLDIGYTF